uniref:Fucolectin tachylectin-4 pentraxin-1 domain-containing protein n=1 Tax=Branchiostoma floridae TaxID=7739 RepID=C3YBB4_BRAFL|eukprot:XP_002606261.1 hypothetical protein BRAFLDRAFT_83987 [Branchiostoma floridae]
MSKTNIRGRPLPALPTSELASSSGKDVDSDKKIEVEDDCEDPNMNMYNHLGQTSEGRVHTDVGTYNQLPVTASFVSNQNYGPGALQQEEIQADDTDRVDCNDAGSFENPMYAAGTLPQDDGDLSASSFRDEETDERNGNPGNNVYHRIDDDEIDNPHQAGHQSRPGGQAAAEDAGNKDPVNSLFENPMYATGALQQDEGDDNAAADSCEFPISFCATRSHLLPLVIIAIAAAVAISAGAGLIALFTSVDEAHPLSPNSSLERSGVNVALGKPAFQTSHFRPPGGAASRAVDGNTDPAYHHGSCTHTSNPGETNPSWWVDLGQSYVIDRVLIFNRQDLCPERINPFNIHIGDSYHISTNPRCGGDHYINLNQPSISVSCQGMKGRYVGVRLPGPYRILTLCEVQVFLGDCYQSLGCWKDNLTDRAIPTLEGTDPRLGDSYGARSNPVEKCYQVAHSRGLTVFAVQDGGQCFGSANGHNTFFKYGRSSACGVDGEGGTSTNEVYLIGMYTDFVYRPCYVTLDVCLSHHFFLNCL